MWSDSVPPAITAVALLSETPDDRYQQVVDDTLEYLDEVAPRTEEGGGLMRHAQDWPGYDESLYWAPRSPQARRNERLDGL